VKLLLLVPLLVGQSKPGEFPALLFGRPPAGVRPFTAGFDMSMA
jgi:hypothetical protein